MPQLDVSLALTNPYTLDTFSVLRRADTSNSFGEATLSTTTFNNVRGVVYPEGDNRLQRLRDIQLQAKAICVITRFALRGSSKDGTGQNFQPDIVVWNGNNFIVELVDDYSQYAAGFIMATCVMTDLNPQPALTR
jgi:hypothetical protein